MDGVRERDEEREKRGETTLRERGWRGGIRERGWESYRGDRCCVTFVLARGEVREPVFCVLIDSLSAVSRSTLNPSTPLYPCLRDFVMPAEFYLKRFPKTLRYLQE